ncbi:HEAT repeat domain-containing protein [Candidatus Micrarchaeota archaeon]|nr:HEAT repeat domain-containing protein [Candidatus Micrarchaeota archaeon]
MYDGFKAPMTDTLLNRLISDLGAERKAAMKEACITLTQYQEKKVVDRLVMELKNNDPDIRRNAAYILGRMGSKEAENGLIPLLEDENPTVRMSACNALGQVGGEKAEDVLIRLISDKLIGESAQGAVGRILERKHAEKEKNGSGEMTLTDLSRGQIIKERQEFMEKADGLLSRMKRITRNDPPEPIAKKPLRKYIY